MKKLNSAILALSLILACGAASAQDTVFVQQVPASQVQPQATQQATPQPVYQYAQPAPPPANQSAQQPVYQAVPQTVYQPAPQAAPQTVYQQNPPQNEARSHERRSSFYLNGGVGFDFSHVYYNHRYYETRTKYKGNGIGYAGELTLGVLIKELIGVHASVEFSKFDGEYNINSRQKSNVNEDIDAILFLVGPGLTAFPFSLSRSPSVMEGTFVSAKAMIGVISLRMPDHSAGSERLAHAAGGFSLELGKDWHLTNTINAGVALKWQYISVGSGDDMAGEENYDDYYHHEHDVNSLQLVFRINRR